MTYSRPTCLALIARVESGLTFGQLQPYADALREAVGEVERLRLSKEHIRTVVENAMIDVASVGPKLSATNFRMMSAAVADRVADVLVPSRSETVAEASRSIKSDIDEESDYEKRNRELHRLGRLAGKP